MRDAAACDLGRLQIFAVQAATGARIDEACSMDASEWRKQLPNFLKGQSSLLNYKLSRMEGGDKGAQLITVMRTILPHEM